MDTELIIEKFKEKFNSEILEIAAKNQKRLIITVKPDSILSIADYLYPAHKKRI
jgi:Ni,Fe-hydrogenase III component G